MAITVDSYELVVDEDTPDGIVSYYIVLGKIDNLPFRWPIEPRGAAEVDGKWDEATAIARLEVSSVDILGTTMFILKTEGLVRLNPTTHEIEFAVPTKEGKDFKARIEALEAAVDALGPGP